MTSKQSFSNLLNPFKFCIMVIQFCIYMLMLYTAVIQSRNNYIYYFTFWTKEFSQCMHRFSLDNWSEIEIAMTVKSSWTNTYQIQCTLFNYDNFHHRMTFIQMPNMQLLPIFFFSNKELIQRFPLGPFFAIF